MTFETFAEKWFANARINESKHQQVNERGYVRRLARLDLGNGRLLGSSPIGLLTIDDWERAFGQLKGAASTLNKIRQAILSMQEWAAEKGYLPRPWLAGKVLKKGGLIARKKGARRDRRLAPDVLDENGRVKLAGEERRLMEKASPWLQRLIIAALETGCRRGELLSLTWADVSLQRAQLTLRAERTKSRTMRQIPISDRLLAVLRLIERDPAGNPHPPTAHVFGDAIGRKVGDPKKSWQKACKTAAIVDLRFHDLRHEAGSRLVERGWPLHHVQRMLGHQDAKTTSIYLNATIHELADSMRRFGTGGHSLHLVAREAKQEPPPLVQQDAVVASKALAS
ncbi:MAG: site-specific integrase [Vicinamibacterales bacterium]